MLKVTKNCPVKYYVILYKYVNCTTHHTNYKSSHKKVNKPPKIVKPT